jgi:mono/diheme cytochrome c family protein
LARRFGFIVFIALAVVLGSTSVTHVMAEAGHGRAAGASADPPIGKRLYRTYCGQCHALAAALAAGFGSANGIGQDGGPSFDDLRVPFNLCVTSLTETFAGHEVLFNDLTLTEIKQVSRYVATVTNHNPVLAKPIYD